MADKKKIAFVANCCIVGGVETALINLLNVIDTEKYDITLFTNFEGNPVVNNISSSIKLVDLDRYNIKMVYREAIANRDYRLALAILWNYAHFRLTQDYFFKTAWLYRHLDFSELKYECVVSYKYDVSTTAIVRNAIKSKRLILWVHSELPMLNRSYEKVLCSYDKCFCVSEYIQSYFLEHCPSMKGKTEVFHNILDAEAIAQKAQEPVNDIDTNRKYVLVTVGRLGQDKGQTIIPETARLLADAEIDFVWYLVGDGPTRDAVEQKIEKYHMQDYVHLLGIKQNPYPYMKACSIYVQTSTSEGWCLTAQEARILHKPCVVTDIPVMHEQFVDGENGIIANGTDARALYDGIMRLVKFPELCRRITENLENNTQDGTSELQKLYDFLDE